MNGVENNMLSKMPVEMERAMLREVFSHKFISL
jgi:hypothetical protein